MIAPGRTLRSRPQLLDELAALLERRVQARSRRLSAYDAERERKALRDRIARFLLRPQPDGRAASAVPAN